MTVLGFYELSDEDRPPEEYFGDDEALSEWFDAVKARRGDPQAEPMERVPMTRNEALREVWRG